MSLVKLMASHNLIYPIFNHYPPKSFKLPRGLELLVYALYREVYMMKSFLFV